jgi:hypothetical protein
MRHFAKIIITIFLGVFFVSCGVIDKIVSPIVSRKYIDKSLKRAEKLFHAQNDKTVIFVPMAHIGTKEGYAEVRAYLDSLKADGFVTFYEGLAGLPFHLDTIADITSPMFDAIVDSVRNLPDTVRHSLGMRQDTLERKSRYIMNFDPIVYTNEYATKGSRGSKNKKYITQNDVDLGLTTDRDIWVDYTTADLVELYEKEYGTIELTPYDFATPLDQPYEQKNITHEWSYASKYRNDLLERRVLESEHKRIAVVYGASHARWIARLLYYLNGYEKEKKYGARKRIESNDEK